MLKKLGGQVEALRTMVAPDSAKSTAAKTDRTDQRVQLATLHAQLLIGGFRKCEADDPEIYFRTIEHTLARYDVEIQREVADASRWEWPPTPFELRERCEAIANERARAKERADNIAKQLEQRRRFDALRAERKPLLSYQPSDSPARLTKIGWERREAQRILDRYEIEAQASARPAESSSVFELDPADWNA